MVIDVVCCNLDDRPEIELSASSRQRYEVADIEVLEKNGLDGSVSRAQQVNEGDHVARA